MPSIKALEKCAEKAVDYKEFRELVWKAQGKTSQTNEDKRLYPTKKKPCVFVPKRNLFLKDLYLFPPNHLHAGTEILRLILQNPDGLRNISLAIPNGAVYVEYSGTGNHHILENQDTDERQSYRGSR